MMQTTGRVFIDNAKVMAKGQVTIPKDVREVLGVTNGDKVVFIVENGQVRIINSAVFAMQMLQEQMKNEAEKRGFSNEEDVAEWIRESRNEEAGK